MNIRRWGAVLAAATVASAIWPRTASAACDPVTRQNVIACALSANLSARSERHALDSFGGRRKAAGLLLPSNPTVSVTGAYPTESNLPDRPVLWSAAVSQEIEIAGQRGGRLDVVAADERAQRAKLSVARRDAAADALLLYFDAVAANEEVKIADRLAAIATGLTSVARARAQAGVGAGVEAQIATASATRLLQGQLAARQRSATALAALASALGVDPMTARPRVEGELSPIRDTEPVAGLAEKALARRAEIALAMATKASLEQRVSLYERLRWPSPTVSVFARNDWIGEGTIGVGLGIPIPLPAPVGRTFAGEISETSALARRAETDAEQVRRAVRLEVTKAIDVLTTRQRQADLYDPRQVEQAHEALRSIAEEIETGRMALRDALFMQQSLIDYLFGQVEAKRQLCFASVELARVAGAPLDAGVP